jgi:hypothetical protein
MLVVDPDILAFISDVWWQSESAKSQSIHRDGPRPRFRRCKDTFSVAMAVDDHDKKSSPLYTRDEDGIALHSFVLCCAFHLIFCTDYIVLAFAFSQL